MKTIGRPMKFKTVEELQCKIDKWLEERNAASLPLTVTSLALALDTTRETLMDYEHKDGFSDTVKRAKLMCQAFAEDQLYSGRNAAGAIFSLKNFGWSDKQEIAHSGHIAATKEQRDASVAAALGAEKE